jgi:hypothetical protein
MRTRLHRCIVQIGTFGFEAKRKRKYPKGEDHGF